MISPLNSLVDRQTSTGFPKKRLGSKPAHGVTTNAWVGALPASLQKSDRLSTAGDPSFDQGEASIHTSQANKHRRMGTWQDESRFKTIDVTSKMTSSN